MCTTRNALSDILTGHLFDNGYQYSGQEDSGEEFAGVCTELGLPKTHMASVSFLINKYFSSNNSQ